MPYRTETTRFRSTLTPCSMLTGMPDRSRKRPRDLNALAKSIVDDATSGEPRPKPEERLKNAAAVELGRMGGLKGGKARAAKLSPERRAEIARKAAAARWQRG
jgi:hypothetical protein